MAWSSSRSRRIAMSADDKIMEALARLEHKMDLVLDMLGVGDPNVRHLLSNIRQVGDTQHQCTLCKQPVEYATDPVDSVVVRKCGCKTGKIALDMKAFAPPVTPAKKENDS